MNLVVILRVYPGVSKRPMVFSDSKIGMWTFSLRSLRTALEGWHGEKRIEILFDACPEEFVEGAVRVFEGMSLKCHRLPRTGNSATFLRQLEIARALPTDTCVYFGEDDYFYLPQAFARAQDLLRNSSGARFITLYDHPDVRILEVHRGPHPRIEAEGQVWRRDYSTCCSFLARAGAVSDRFEELASYSSGNTDCGMWLSLTRAQVYSPIRWFLCYMRGDWDQLTYVLSAWRYCARRMLTSRAEDLWTATPGLATHLESTGIGADRDWREIVVSASRMEDSSR
jgi:hypothetical protein